MGADFDVVIVGAGAAGIAAARRLAAAQLSVLLIEASSRIGGRAWSCETAGLRLDLGCEWLHSADRNPWTRLAEQMGFTIERRAAAWGSQYRDLGFSQSEQTAARKAYSAWSERLATAPPANDFASDAMELDGHWNAYIAAICGYVSGASPGQYRLDNWSRPLGIDGFHQRIGRETWVQD
jgi:monoamine oxidase